MSLEHIQRLFCTSCGQNAGRQALRCASCGDHGRLELLYDLGEVGRTLTLGSLERREPWMWRYRELLPMDEPWELPSLHVGMTPLYGASRLAEWVGIRALFLKDEGRNPTGCIADRASAVAVAKAREKAAKAVAAALPPGDALSLAAFSAAAELPAFLFVPGAPPQSVGPKLAALGARVIQVNAMPEEVERLCGETCERFGWYPAGAANPFRLEGLKTAGLEIAEQLCERMPDWVVLSAEDASTLRAVRKGLEQMRELGLIQALPRLLFARRAREQPLIESEGTAVEVSEDECLEALRAVARRSALFAGPPSAAAVAGLKKALAQEQLPRDATALVLLTEASPTGPDAALPEADPPLEVGPELAFLEQALRKRGWLG